LNVIAEILRIDSAGVIDGSRERIRRLSPETTGESSHGAHLKRIVKRLGIRHALPDTDKVGIPPSQLGLENLVAVDDDRRRQINITDANQVIATGAGIADGEVPVPRQLPLNGKVVLHDVWRLQVKADDLQLRLNRVGIKVRDNIWEGRIGQRSSGGEWRIQTARKEVVFRQNLVEKYSKPGPHRRLSSLERIPYQSHPWRKILQ